MLRQGVLHHIERDRLDVSGVAPRRVYLGPEGTPGHYVIVDTRSEATAWLGLDAIASAPGRVLLYDTAAEETNPLYAVTSTLVLA